MSTSLTIYPIDATPSPARAGKATAPDIVNDDFFSSFSDLLDIINPLQHIPGVSTAYRELTGDTISQGATIAGGTLFGGPLGFVTSLLNSVVAQETGKDIGANLYAAVAEKYRVASV